MFNVDQSLFLRYLIIIVYLIIQQEFTYKVKIYLYF